jgi:hypothetical protein
MTWHAIYETVSGQLVSVGQVVAEPLPDGLTDLVLTDQPPDTQMWDPVTHTYIARPVKVRVDRLDDLQSHPSFADFLTAYQSLSVANRTRLRNALILLLGRYRFRNQSESPESLG